MPELVIKNGKNAGRRIKLPAKELLVGRDEGCFLKLASADVSRRHCSLIPTSRGLLVRDLGSPNGTFVNGRRVQQEAVLRDGDVLQIGPLRFEAAGFGPRLAAASGDDSVLEWLSERDTSVDIPQSQDTKVLHHSAVAAAETEPAADRVTLPPVLLSGTSPPPGSWQELTRQRFATVAEEARDIIRRHHESLGHRGG